MARQSPAGRTFFLTPRPKIPFRTDGEIEYPLVNIVPFTEHRDVIRRGGTASTLKYVLFNRRLYGAYVPPLLRNCAFNASAHRALLSSESTTISIPPSTLAAPGIDILPYLLLPLAGPEEFDLEVCPPF